MAVVLLVGLIWAMILVPPVVRAHTARREAFLVSLGEGSVTLSSPPPLRSEPVRRRRRIAGGLLVAMAATLLVGFLPPFRALLVVHLFLVDLFLAYIGLLAYSAERTARRRAPVAQVAVPPVQAAPALVPVSWLRRGRGAPAPAVLSSRVAS